MLVLSNMEYYINVENIGTLLEHNFIGWRWIFKRKYLKVFHNYMEFQSTENLAHKQRAQ